MFGILNVHKPTGWTSRDVVNLVQKRIRPVKVGHAGTLDPLATGVLVLCLSAATRLIEYIQRQPKHYLGTFLLGCRSDTEDIEGNVEPIEGAAVPGREELERVIRGFRGQIDQVPPRFSAAKVQGKRAYRLARQGEAFELASRQVTIERIELLSYEYPRFQIDVRCGGGTYLRSLGRDIGEAARSGAVMQALERRAVGPFRLNDAVEVSQLREGNLEELLLPPHLAVEGMSQVQLADDEVERLSHGQTISRAAPAAEGEIAGIDKRGRLVAILTVQQDGQQLRAVKNFSVQ